MRNVADVITRRRLAVASCSVEFSDPQSRGIAVRYDPG